MIKEQIQKIQKKVEQIKKEKSLHLAKLQEDLSGEKEARANAERSAQAAEDAGHDEAYGAACASMEMRTRRIRKLENEISRYQYEEAMSVREYDVIRDELSEAWKDASQDARGQIYSHLEQIQKVIDEFKETSGTLSTLATELKSAAGSGRDGNGGELYRAPVACALPNSSFMNSLASQMYLYKAE